MSANRRFLKYGIKGRSTWYIAHCPLFGVSAKRGFTVYLIPILSPFLFIPFLYSSFLNFIGFFIYMSPLIFIYTQC